MGAKGWGEDDRELRVRQTRCLVLAVCSFLICEMGARAGTSHRRTTGSREQQPSAHDASCAFAHPRAALESGPLIPSVSLINRHESDHATCPSQTGSRRQSWGSNPGCLGPGSATLLLLRCSASRCRR